MACSYLFIFPPAKKFFPPEKKIYPPEKKIYLPEKKFFLADKSFWKKIGRVFQAKKKLEDLPLAKSAGNFMRVGYFKVEFFQNHGYNREL